MEPEIVPAGPERVSDLAVLLGRAFADDRIVTWPFDADHDLERATR